jgi:hypothetical protein
MKKYLFKGFSLFVLCVLVLMGTSCTQGTEISDTSDEFLSTYEKVTLSDLPSTGTSHIVPSDIDADMTYEDVAKFYLDDYLGATIELVINIGNDLINNNSGSVSAKSMSALLALHLDDEGLVVKDTEGNENVEVYADYLDLIASANTDNLVDFFLNFENYADTDVTGAIRLGLSTRFVFNTTEEASDNGLSKALASVYIDISGTGIDPDLSEGSFSGNVKISLGSTYCDELSTDVYLPFVMQVSLKKFEDVSVANLIDAYSQFSNLTDETTSTAAWNAICDDIWGSHNQDDYLEAKIMFADANGNELTGETLTYQNLDCLAFLNTVFGAK